MEKINSIVKHITNKTKGFGRRVYLLPCEPDELYIDVESAESCKLDHYNGNRTELEVRG